MVGPQPPRARLARGAWRNARSLPGLALRSAAAADDRPGGDALLSGLHRQMASGRGPGRRPDRSRHERVRGSRLLFARAQSARLRQGNRSARRDSFRARKPNCGRFPASAPIPPRRSRRSPSAARPRRSTAISRAFWRGSSRWKSRSLAREPNSRRRRARWRQPQGGRFRPSADGHRRDALPPPQSRLRPLPARPRLRGVPAGVPEAYPRPRRGEGETAPAGRGVLRPPLRRRLSRSPPPAAWPSRLDHRTAGHAVDEQKARMIELAGTAPVAARWRRLPGDVEQVFTHFALKLTVYAAEFEGRRPGRLFLGRARRDRRGGILEHDAQGGRARPDANVTAQIDCYGKVKASPLISARSPGCDEPQFWRGKTSACPWRP